MSKDFIIIQHIDIETPGYILDLMKKDKFNLTTIEPVSYTHLTLPTTPYV